MCLLIWHPKETQFDEDDLKDFYKHNSDGFGIMWAENNCLYSVKRIPVNGDEAWAIYQEFCLGKACVLHHRMKTHGFINMDNCHPYTVFGDGSAMPLSLMHNGILACGNAKDVAKSDTWHYIEDYLKPLLADHPEMIRNPIMQELIGEHIGSGNRMIFMNHIGEVIIVNEEDFVTYKGALLSNTYAWDSHKGGYGYKRTMHSSYVYEPYDAYDNYSYMSGEHVAPQRDATVRGAAQSFFMLLNSSGYTRAFQELTFVEAETSIDDCGFAIWKDFVESVEDDWFTDEEIVQCIRDTNKLIDMLYYNDEVKDEHPDHNTSHV